MPRSGTLYVFLNGLAVIREWPGELEIVLPDVPGHVFKAGSFLNETPIEPQSTLRLLGVSKGTASFTNTQHVIQLSGCSTTHRGRAATIRLDPPKAIYEFLRATAPNLARTANGTLSWSDLSSIQVLAYDYPDENEVFLDGHYWQPCSCDGSISLHLISTSDGPEGTDHQADTERTLHDLVQGYPGLVFLKPAPVPPAFSATADPLYPTLVPLGLQADQGAIVIAQTKGFAFDQAELEAFSTRSVRLNRLGRLKQYGGPIATLWLEPDPLGELPCNCSPLFLG